MNRPRKLGCKELSLGLALLLLGVIPCPGQLNATLSGTVSDETGATIPGASVIATEISTGIAATVPSNDAGSYSFLALPPGIYRLRVDKAGFKAKTFEGIEVRVAQKAIFDVRMEVGSVSTVVDVKADIPLVETATASISTVIDSTSTTQLPLNLRRFGSLAVLVPGAVSGIDRPSGDGFNPTATGTIYTANGGRNSGNNPLVDGVMSRELSGGAFGVQPTPDAVQEFRIQTNVYSAEYGLSSGSVIALVTKSGTNSFHGNVYEFLRNQVFDARNYFSPPGTPKGKYIRNQFGFSIGGPIRRGKTFFFGNFEPLRQIQGSSATATIPTAAQKAGDLSSTLTGVSANLCGSGGPSNLNFDTGQLFDPATVSSFTCPAGSANGGTSILIGNPIPGNIIAHIDPVAQKALTTLYDVTPNRAGTPNYFSNTPNTNNDYNWLARVDHTFGPRDSIFARYMLSQTNYIYYNALPLSGTTQYYRGQSAVAGWTHTYSSSLLQEAWAGFQRDFQVANCQGCPRAPGTTASFGVQGLTAINPDLEEFPQFNFLPSASRYSASTFTSVGDGAYTPLVDPDMVESYQYHLSKTLHRHTIQVGADMNFWQSLRTQAAFAPAGLFYFNGQYSSLASESIDAGTSPLADFLLGYPQSAQRTFSFNFMYQRGGGYWNYFVQDDFRATSHLTLNIGLRYEYRRPATEKYGNYVSFLPTGPAFSGPGNALLITAFPAAKNDALCTDPQFSYLKTADGRCLIATDAQRSALGFTGRRRKTIIAPEHYLFGPRFGLSWQAFNSDRLIVHAGAGMFYDFSLLNDQHYGDNNPVSAPSQIYSTTFGAPPPLLPNGQITTTATAFTGTAGIPPLTSQFLATFVDPDHKTPKIEEWSFGIESAVSSDIAVQINYVGNHAYHLGFGEFFSNQPLPGLGQPPRPYPDFNSTFFADSRGFSNYNALQVKVTKRMSHGLSLLGGYTWGKALDNNEGDECYGCGSGNSGPQNFNDINADYGPGATDVRGRFVVSSVWMLPFGKGQLFLGGSGRVVDHLVGGWALSGIFTDQSGFPLTVIAQNDFSNTGSASPRPDTTCSGRGSRTVTNFLNASCFSTTALQAAFQAGHPRFGNSGRGILPSWNFINLDAALLKNTAITDRFQLQFRAEAYNTLNKPQFADPNTTFGNQNFGITTSTRADPRDIQFGLKLSF